MQHIEQHADYFITVPFSKYIKATCQHLSDHRNSALIDSHKNKKVQNFTLVARWGCQKTFANLPTAIKREAG